MTVPSPLLGGLAVLLLSSLVDVGRLYHQEGFQLHLTTSAAMSVTGTFLAWFLVSYLYAGMGITLGYHRLLTHKALKVPAWLKYFIVSGGYLALMGAPISWVATHRLHHQKSDQPGDPHSPRDGMKHALYAWMMNMSEKQPPEEVRRQTPDIIDDPVLKLFGQDHTAFQGYLCLTINILWRAAIWYFFGPVAFAANFLAGFIVFWSPQFVNTFCHLKEHGYRLWDVRDDSRNVWWVAILACGEGWHNNHHALPKSARHGMMWWEFDITWMTILLLEKLGLATDVVRPDLAPLYAKNAKAKEVGVGALNKAKMDSAELVNKAKIESAELAKKAEEAISAVSAKMTGEVAESVK